MSGAMYLNCTKYSTEGGVIRLEIKIRCVVDYIISQSKIPVRESKYRLDGDVLVIEVAPDIESILNTVLNR